MDFFHFYENDINILIGVAINLYLAFGSVQMSAVLTLKSMSKICHFDSACLVHSLSGVCSVQCAGRVSLEALCPSLPDVRVSGGGMGL